MNYDSFKYMGKKKKDKYFEGWYFKHVNSDGITLSIIPGISKLKNDSHAFIQIIESFNNTSKYIRYKIDEFKVTDNCVRIGNSAFSEAGIDLNIEEKDFKLKGNITYSGLTRIKNSVYSPTIMGPFSYFKFMECNHSIVSLKHNLEGVVQLNGTSISFNNGIGYIEKDYGTSFPKRWTWIQGNDKDSCLFFSHAVIPFLGFKFYGLICIVYISNKEYRFSTYLCSKVVKYNLENNLLQIVVKGIKYTLEITVKLDKSSNLKYPKNGKMIMNLFESLTSNLSYTLYRGENLIYKKDNLISAVEVSDYKSLRTNMVS